MRKKENNKMLKTNNKIQRLLLLLAFLLLIYIGRLFSLQILDIENYRSKGNNVSKIGNLVSPDRGNIYDRNGNPLAITQKIESLYLLPTTSEKISKEAETKLTNENLLKNLSNEEKEKLTKLSSIATYKEGEVEKLAQILGIDAKSIFDMIAKNEEGFIYKSLNKSQKDRIQILNLPFVKFISQNDRYYPNNDILANTLGFIDNDGKAYYGLEKYYDDVLSGVSGYREFYKALHGTEIPFTDNNDYKKEDAKNLKTSIDIDFQKIVNNVLTNAMFKYKPISISAILSNPNNGEIIALESLPTFDSNMPRRLDSEIDKMFLSKENTDSGKYLLSKWKNRMVSNQYEPGSTFKVITSATALEADNSLKNKVYNDTGYIELAPGVVIKSWRFWNPHGKQTLREALKNSSNPVFVQVARDIGKENFIKYTKNFGFGTLSGIDMPMETKGFYPSNAEIPDVDFGTLSYGHYSNVNQFQLISALNSVVNGGKYFKPHIGKEIINNEKKTIFEIGEDYIRKTVSEDTSKEINEYLEYTADSYGLNSGNLKFGAKTGSALKYETKNIFRKAEDNSDIAITSIFVTYPANSPKYSLLVTIDEPLGEATSSTTALPVAKEIMEKILENDKSEESKLSKKSKLVKIPDITGKSLKDAKEILEKVNLKISENEDINEYTIISKQYPTADNLIAENSEISIEFTDKIKIPNLIGKDIKEIENILKNSGMRYEIIGKRNKVINQSIPKNSIVNKDSTLKIFTEE